jgi:signal transduction histidine kinase/CheY-like chemotaxis protein/HPt (histidine-containing phosphotransfer) domain-containing protein
LRVALDNMPGGIISIDPHGDIEFANQSVNTITDLPPGLICHGRPIEDTVRHLVEEGHVLPKGPDASFESNLDAAMVPFRIGRPVEYDTTLGNGRTVRNSTSLRDDGGIVLVFTDVTQARADERNSKLLSEAFDTFSDMVILYDRHETVVFTNNRYHEIYPNSPAKRDIIGCTMEKLLRRSLDAGQITAPLAHSDPEKWLVEALASRRDNAQGTGETKHASGRTFLFQSRKTAEGGMMLVQSDITERKHAEAEMASALDTAEVATRAKDAFLATMSHEIRTPMNGVIGMIDLLGQTTLNVDQRRMATTIRESAFALLTIINDILDFSKIEAGKLDLENLPISIGNVVDSVAETMAPNAEKKGVTLTVFAQPNIPLNLRGDQVRIRQVLFNLLGNAIKFTEEGSVTLHAWPESSPTPAGCVAIHYLIKDDGIGMTPEQMGDLFTPFAQAEASTTRRYGGTGLGLTIVARLVALMGGTIDVRSDFGKGSEFEVTIPHTLDSQRAPGRDDHIDLKDVRVLALGEPGELRTRMVREYLEADGASVTFESRRDALADRALDAWNIGSAFDVVLLAGAGSSRSAAAIRAEFQSDDKLKATRFVLSQSTFTLGTTIDIPDTTLVAGAPLTRRNLTSGVAVAAGRASPDVTHDRSGHHRSTRAPPTIDEAIKNDELILVVEDNLTNQDVITRQLRMLGYTSEVVGDGALGLEAVATRRHAIVLSDVHMPNVDGLEMTRLVRESETSSTIGNKPRLPIIAITANALRGEAEVCLAAGMDDYLPKPLETHKLQAMLRRWLPHIDTQAFDGDHEHSPQTQRTPPADLAGADDAVDVTVLTEMFGDDNNMLREVLGDFREQALTNVADMREAIEAGNAEDLSFAAHKLKSSAHSVGASALGDLCEALEHAGTARDWATINQRGETLEPMMKAVAEFIEAV